MTYRLCGPANNPTMAVHVQKGPESSNCSVAEAGSLSWSSVPTEEVVANDGEGMDILVGQEQAGEAKKFLPSMSLYRLPAEGMPRLNLQPSSVFPLQRSRLDMDLPTSK